MSITQVAKLAGVSTATVSRVINENPSVSPEAVRTVLEVINRLNYRPRRSRRRRTRASLDASATRSMTALALVVPEVRAGFFPSLIQSFDAAAAEFSHQVLTCNTDNSSAKQADVILHLIEKRVAGVALMPTSVGPPPAHHVRNLQNAGIPVILLHRGIEGVSVPLLALPYEDIAYRAATTFCEGGHKRVAAIFSHDGAVTVQYRRGLTRAIEERQCELPDELVHFGSAGITGSTDEEHEAGVEAAVMRMLELPPQRRPTGFFVPWESDAELVYFLLTSLGVRVPEDVSLITFGSSWRGSSICRRMCAITVNETEVGRMAAQLLVSMASGEESRESGRRLTIPLGFHEGKTLAPLSAG